MSRSVVAGCCALALLAAGGELRRLRPALPGWHVAISVVPPVVFVCAAVICVRSVAEELEGIGRRRGGVNVGNTLRMLVLVAGYSAAVVGALSITNYPLGHVLLGASIIGVVVGIAAQQSLGNVFAGFVLLMARPFAVGNHIRVRSGALGGEFHGTVLSMSLTYVTISTTDGVLKVPNSSVLASAIGPSPRPPDSIPQPPPAPAHSTREVRGRTPVER